MWLKPPRLIPRVPGCVSAFCQRLVEPGPVLPMLSRSSLFALLCPLFSVQTSFSYTKKSCQVQNISSVCFWCSIRFCGLSDLSNNEHTADGKCQEKVLQCSLSLSHSVPVCVLQCVSLCDCLGLQSQESAREGRSLP